MPFTCIFQLNNGAIQPHDHIVFLEYIDSAFGTYHQEVVDIAKVRINGIEAFISTNCSCFPSAKGQLTSGDNINADTKIGFFAANGEDIPYNKPYATIRFLSRDVEPSP